jgi:DNA polymerase III sliding clamp (beta) subunit (PCNA family)
LSTRDGGQSIHIDFSSEHGDDDPLYFHFTGENGFAKHFEMPLIDIESEIMHIPVIEYQAEFSLPSATFAGLIQQLQLFGDTVQFECSEEKVQLCSTSVETGKMSVDIPIDDLSEFSIDEGETMNLSFSLVQLRNICQYSKVAKEIDIKLSSTFPICIRYVFDKGTGGLVSNADGQGDSDETDDSSSARIMFYLAPKMNNDD